MLNKKALAASVSAPPKVYVDDVFSTYLYTGNGSTQTINNGIDLAGKGGLVWIKNRDQTNYGHALFDTNRGVQKEIFSNLTSGQSTFTDSLTNFLPNGFTLGADTESVVVNSNGKLQSSWTFRKAKKFFDVVTYTGDGQTYKNVNHSLGTTPGFVIYKRLNSTGDWHCWTRRSNGTYDYLKLNTTDTSSANLSAVDAGLYSTYFQPGAITNANINGATYVAYLFAHDAGGFGETGTDNIISCGSFVHDGTTEQTINLGYEPQFVLIKGADTATGWSIMDNMRGAPVGGNAQVLFANDSGAEFAGQQAYPTANGFAVRTGAFLGGTTHIYMAIRRPMKPPTSGTQVFSPVLGLNVTSVNGLAYNFGFPPDAVIEGVRGGAGYSPTSTSRLTGNFKYMITSATDAEGTEGGYRKYTDSMQGMTYGGASDLTAVVGWGFKRATGFFDEVCYTGTGSNRTVAHNLGAVPEMVIVKGRSNAGGWCVGSTLIAANARLELQQTSAIKAPPDFGDVWNNTRPTSTVFSVGTDTDVNGSGRTYVAYLFATVAGVSKVGSYTGDGTDGRVINCGFTGGARFVLIKSTSNTGNWRVWDTARGIVSGNDPFLALNTTAAESTNSDDIDPTSSGFIVNYNGLSAINESGWEYIFLAIA